MSAYLALSPVHAMEPNTATEDAIEHSTKQGSNLCLPFTVPPEINRAKSTMTQTLIVSNNNAKPSRFLRLTRIRHRAPARTAIRSTAACARKETAACFLQVYCPTAGFELGPADDLHWQVERPGPGA